jgi:PAS domain S-box-containing protein
MFKPMTKEKKTYYLIYTFFLVFFIAISYVAYRNYTDQKRVYTEQFNEYQRLLVKNIAAKTQDFVDNLKEELEALADSYPLREGFNKEKSENISAFYKSRKNKLSAIRVYDRHGILIFALPLKRHEDKMNKAFTGKPFFKDVRDKKEMYVSNAQVNDSGERVIILSAPLFGLSAADADFNGAIVASLRLNIIEDIFSDTVSENDKGYIWGIDNLEDIIVHSKSPLLAGRNVKSELRKKGYAGLYEIALSMLTQKSGKGIYEYESEKNYVAYAPVILNPKNFWSIAISTPVDVVQKINKENFKYNIAFVILLLILFFISNYVIYRTFKKLAQIKLEKEMSEEKRQAEKKYRTLFENAANIIFIISSDGYSIESHNKCFSEQFDLSGNSYIGSNFLNMLDEGNQKVFIENFKNALDRDSDTYELSIKSKRSDKEKVFSITNTLVKGKDYKKSVQCIGVDITAKKQLSNELNEVRNRLQAVFDGMHVGLSLISKDFDVIMVNRFQADSLKNSVEYFIGRKCYKAFRKKNTICEDCPAVAMLQEKLPKNHEFKIKPRSGKERSYNLYTYPVYDTEGEIYSFISSVQDVTEMKSLETEVMAKERELKMIDRVSYSLNERLDLDSILKNVLITLLELLKFSRGIVFLIDREIKKKVMRANIGLSDNFMDKLTELWGSEGIINEFMRNKTSITIEDIKSNDKVSFDLKKLFEKERIELFTLLPIRVKDIVIGIIILFDTIKRQDKIHDLWLLDSIGREIGRAVEKSQLYDKLKTYKKELKKTGEIVKEKEKLEALNELAGVTAHELNQPLTTIVSYAELLMNDTQEDSGIHQTLKVISEEVMRISGMVKKIASVTKYETKKYIANTKIITIEKDLEEE